MAPASRAEPAYAVKPGGARSLGVARIIPDDHDDYPGYELCEAGEAEMEKRIRLPCWGWAHSKKGKKDGGGDGAFAFLAVTIMNPPEDPYGAVFEGFYVCEKDDMSSSYGKWPRILTADDVSKTNFKNMKPSELILDLNWRDTVSIMSFEPSATVKLFGKDPQFSNTDLATEDPDSMDVTYVLRKKTWKKDGWLRLERIDKFLDYSASTTDLLNLQLGCHDEALLPVPTTIAPTSNLLTLVTADMHEGEECAEDCFINAGVVYLTGKMPGSNIFFGAEYMADGAARSSFCWLLGRPYFDEDNAWVVDVRELLRPDVAGVPQVPPCRAIPARAIPARAVPPGCLSR